jgi:hypothetical protein
MAGTKRTPLNRHRKPTFDSTTVRLFLELDATPEEQREDAELSGRRAFSSTDSAWTTFLPA